jgi:hypothetical protein
MTLSDIESSPMPPLADSNRYPLGPELMKQLLLWLAELPVEQRSDPTSRSIALMRRLHEFFPTAGTVALVGILLSFEFRAEGLARLREHPAFGAWAYRAEKAGATDLISQTLVEIAAVEPLVEQHGRPAFEPDAFFQIALATTEVVGRA